MSFRKHTISGSAPRHLFNSEIEELIKSFANSNDLILPSDFKRLYYQFCSQTSPNWFGPNYEVVFLARPKTPDEILGSQIEYQIKKLEK